MLQTVVEDDLGYEPTYTSVETAPFVTTIPTAVIDPRRYVIRRELARGGMGRVSIADDTILGRTVAIKELLEPRGDLARRFQRELALTARLQHPSIVSIHDGGRWTTGELVYVMRLVSGDSLDAVISRHASPAERLALLPHAIAVVDALAYAHSQDIIHRDLKPANIVIGEFGETVVIDWGLAKDLSEPETSSPLTAPPVHGGNGRTVAGAVIGTPSYMPPDQAAAESVDARADVYALGAVLYHMLAGTPPHRGRSVEAVLESALSGTPIPLDVQVAGLPSDLLAIVAKAMAADPDDRYANAGELAIDLKRFQRGQLVAAHRYSTWQLARRWFVKHRAAVVTTAIAAIVIACVGIASIARIVREQERSADAERIAESNRRDAEQLMDFMLVDLRKGLEPVGKLDLLSSVATRARAYYDRRPADDAHRRILARQNLGEVLEEQGDLRGALAEHVGDLAIAQVLVLADPSNATSRTDLAASHREVGYLLEELADLPAAVVEFSASAAVAREALARGVDAGWQRELEAAELGTGRVLLAQGNAPRALVADRIALDLAATLVAITPTDRVLQRDAMLAHHRVASALAELGDRDGALAEHRAELALATPLASDPADTVAQRDLSIAHDAIGYLLKKRHDLDGALVEFRASEHIADELARHDPGNANWQRDLAISSNTLSKLLLEAQGLRGRTRGVSRARRWRSGSGSPKNRIRRTRSSSTTSR